MNFYVYYSYENWGRGYIGKRKCACSPEGDSDYFGSFSDKLFRPENKIILATFDSEEKALEAEVLLHSFFEVNNNPHFANRAQQTSSKFCYDSTGKPNPGSSTKRRELNLSANPMKNAATREKLKSTLNTEEVRQRKSKALKEARTKPSSRQKSKDSAIEQWNRPGAREAFSKKRTGQGNPCFGRYWITNGERNVFIRRGDAIPDGFWPGRKC
jgi:hypothetical protein